jgi:hypothetical protein
LLVIAEIYPEAVVAYNITPMEQKMLLINFIKEHNYPLPIILADGVLVSHQSVFAALLLRDAVDKKILPASTQVMTIQSIGAAVPNFNVPGYLSLKTFMLHYMSLTNNTRIKTKNDLVFTEVPQSLYSIFLYKNHEILEHDLELYHAIAEDIMPVVIYEPE